MDSYVTINLSLLQKNFNNIYQLLMNNQFEMESYRLVTSRSGVPNLEVISNNGLPVNMYSKYDPLYEVGQWAVQKQDEFTGAKHIFIYGFGLGYHVEQIIGIAPESTLHIIEPDIRILFSALQSRDLTRILNHPKIGIFGVGKDTLTSAEFVDSLTLYVSDSFCAAYTPFYMKEYANEIDEFIEIFRSNVLSNRTNFATQYIFKKEWPENIVLNLPITYRGRPLSGMRGLFKDHVALAVGSGPSLDNDIELIRKHQDNFIIIAAGSSVQNLVKKGIRPHLVVSVDGSEKNYQVFANLDITEIPLVYASYIKNKIIDNIKHDLYHVFISTDTITSHIFDNANENQFYTTASVTGTVLQVAELLGCRTVVLAGQDFSYPEKKRYSEGINHFTVQEVKSFEKFMTEEVENVMGGFNPTSGAMKNMMENIEHLIAYLKTKNMDFINTSRIGARIKGTRELPMGQLLVELKLGTMPPGTFRKLLQEKSASYSNEKKSRVRQRTEACRDEIKKLLETAMLQVLKELDKLAHQLQKKDSKRIVKTLEKINKNWDKITSSKVFDPIYGFVLQAEIPIYARRIPEIISCQDIYKKGELVFKHLGRIAGVMYKDSERLIELFDQALAKMAEEEVGV